MRKEVIFMKEFVPAEKMSKKAKKELAKKSRRIWEVSPVSRKIENKKHYNRKRNSHERYDNAGMGIFFFSNCRLFFAHADQSQRTRAAMAGDHTTGFHPCELLEAELANGFLCNGPDLLLQRRRVNQIHMFTAERMLA